MHLTTQVSWLVISCALLLLLTPSCGALRGDVPPAGPSGIAAGLAAGLSTILPDPAAALRQASGTGVEQDGANFDAGLPAQHVTANAPVATFRPDWDSASSPQFSGVAFALYSFYLFEFFGESRISISWTGAPPAAGLGWLGLANHAKSRWDWFPIPASHTIAISNLADYRQGLTLVAAVAVIGTQPVELRKIWLGEQANGYYEIEDNDTYDTANALPARPFPPPTLTGSIGAATGYPGYDGDSADWYAFTLTEAGVLAVNIDVLVSGGDSYAHFDFKKDDGTGQPKDWRGYATDGAAVRSTLYCPAAGTYWLAVTSTSLAGDYTIAMSFAPATLFETEDNDSWEQADALPELPVGFGAVYGSVGDTDTPDSAGGEVVYDGDNDDWFSFDVTQRTLVSVELRCLGYSSTDHELYMPDGVTLLTGKYGVHTPDRTVAMLPDAGKYYVHILKSTTSTHTNYFLMVQTGSNGLGWLNQPADSNPDAKSTDDCALCLVDGRPAIAFVTLVGADTTLAYTRALDAEGSAWGPIQYLDGVGGYRATQCSMTLVGGNPAIGFCTESFSAMDLKYIRATDPQGGAWDNAVVVDNGANYVGSGVSLAVINDNPALSYYMLQTGHALRYARALDSSGAAWGAPSDVAPSTSANQYTDSTALLSVMGAAAIAYIDPTGAVEYVRASDADGTAWGAPVELFRTTGYIPSRLSMAIAAGAPAIAFDTTWSSVGSGNHIFYVRATDTAGTAWGAALDVVAESDSFTTAEPALAMIGGKPAIAFNAAALKYIAARDTAGSAWGLIETPDDTSGSGIQPALAEINGNPGIAHRMFAADNLRYSELF